MQGLKREGTLRCSGTARAWQGRAQRAANGGAPESVDDRIGMPQLSWTVVESHLPRCDQPLAKLTGMAEDERTPGWSAVMTAWTW